MENVGLNMDGYFDRLKRLLNCPGPVRASFLDQTRRMAEDFIRSNPDATSQDVADFLGDPQELARGFLETLEPDVLEHYCRKKKFLRWGCVSILAVMLVVVSALFVWHLSLPMNSEITYTTVIHYDSMEGKS